MICSLRTLYYTLRYPSEGLFQGLFLSGHSWQPTGEIHQDHWELECSRCGQHAGSEINPNPKAGDERQL